MKKENSWLREHRIIILALTTLAAVIAGSIFLAVSLMNSPDGLARAQSTQTWITRRPYSDDSPWNTPISPKPTYDPHSHEMVQTLSQTADDGSKMDRSTYPVYFAGNSTPRYNIPCLEMRCTIVDGTQTHGVEVLEGVPVPPGARPSSGKDAQIVIIDTVNGFEYGLLRAEWIPTGWQAGSGYRYDLTGSGTVEALASRGSGIPYYAGLIRPWEIRAGAIEHALAFAYDEPASRCVYPASKGDGSNDDPYALPEGARLQLNPALTESSFDAWGLSPAGKIVARALQQYGMFVVDRGGAPRFMAEDLFDNPLTSESWEARDLQYTDDVVADIPYQEFRVLALPRAYWNEDARATTFGECLNYP